MIVKRIILKFLIFYLDYLCKGDDEEDLWATPKNLTITTVKGSFSEVGELSHSVIFYEVQLHAINFRKYRAPICSGNVLTSRWVLTTATPLGFHLLQNIVMYAGTMTESSITNNSEAQFDIDKIIIHPEWHEHDFNNLGLARTTKNITFGIGLGNIRIPLNFNFASNNETITCKMTLWAPTVEHLMGRLQSTILLKQSVYFKVANDPQICPNDFIQNKTLCLLQVHDKRTDVCSVSVGSAIMCGFGAVAIFTGGKNYMGCVDKAPQSYSALNLYGYVVWIQEIVNYQILIENYTVQKISCSDLVSFNFSLLSLGQLILYFNALNVV